VDPQPVCTSLGEQAWQPTLRLSNGHLLGLGYNGRAQ
jgi:hypothetical protein